jgi:serine/threonine protein kinase
MTDSGFEPDPLGQVADEFLERYRRGERPALSEYTRRHPELAEPIRKLLRALVVMEDVRPSPETTAGASTRTAAPPQRLGEYRIIREIGRGGMGVVYEAEQLSLGRRVALKVLPPGAEEDAPQVQRFRREARAAARLHHTNIVPVFAVGADNGMYYYVMQYIEGRPLSQVLTELRRIRCRANRRLNSAGGEPAGQGSAAPAGAPPTAEDVAASLWNGRFGSGAAHQPPPSAGPDEADSLSDAAKLPPSSTDAVPPPVAGPADSAVSLSGPHRLYPKNVAHVGVQVAEALECAAAQGVLHRDVKPSNLLLDVRGNVWLTDFGLAKATGTEDLTAKNDLLGTLRYMAPERFDGRADVRSDVYALGLTLYEMLALRPAFDDPAPAQLARQIAAADPPRLDRLDPSLPWDLVTIVHKAMAKDAADRYQTPGAMAEDLRRFLDDRPIAARRAGLAEQAWRWGRRNPTAGALAVTALALVGLAVGGGFWEQHQQGVRRAEAARARQEVESALRQVADLWQQGRYAEARAVLERLGDAGADDLRQRLDQARADLGLSKRLADIRLRRANHFAGDESDCAALARDYAQALADAGLVVGSDETALTDRIRTSAIHEQLVAALDDWALAAFVLRDEGLRERLLRLARRADPNPAWRDRFRDPAVWRDRGALERLAHEAPVAELPPRLLVLLGSLLELAKADPEPLLRAAQRLRPNHFWLNWELGNVLLAKKRPAEAAGFYRAALVTRPESGAVYNSLGLALQAQGRTDEVLDAFRKAIELDPYGSAAHHNLVIALARQGRMKQALAEFRQSLGLDAAARVGVTGPVVAGGSGNAASGPR